MAKANLSGIRNIIFDMGGVIIDIDYNLTAKAFEKCGIAEFDKIFNQASQLDFIIAFERGEIEPAEFRKQIRSKVGINLSDLVIDECWNALILDLQSSRVKVIEKLAQQYKLYLLSNNNAIHFKKLKSKIEQVIPFPHFCALFQKTYFSHLIQLQKPSKESFLLVINENQLKPEETLFVDDSVQHIKSAAELGLRTLLVHSNQPIEKLF